MRLSCCICIQSGELIERRLHQRKWKWVVHGNPKGHLLTSITCTSQDKSSNHNSNSLLLTTAAGFVFEYQLLNNQGSEDFHYKFSLCTYISMLRSGGFLLAKTTR